MAESSESSLGAEVRLKSTWSVRISVFLCTIHGGLSPRVFIIYLNSLELRSPQTISSAQL